MNGMRVRVSARSRLIECIFATGLPFGGREDLPETLQELARLLPQTAGVRRWGAAALDLAYVAAGRYDGYWERNLNAWDMAAGLLLVREAGGLVDGFERGTNPVDTGSVIAAAEPVYEKFSSTLRG